MVVVHYSTVIKNTDRSPSAPNFGDVRFSDIDALVPDDSGVTNQSLSEMPDLVCDFDNKPARPCRDPVI